MLTVYRKRIKGDYYPVKMSTKNTSFLNVHLYHSDGLGLKPPKLTKLLKNDASLLQKETTKLVEDKT